MPPTKCKPLSLTVALRNALAHGPSLYHIEKELGLDHRSLGRFRSGESSLRLDLADKLAAYLGVEIRAPSGRKEA